MVDDETIRVFESLAEEELAAVASCIPVDVNARIALFSEVLRVIDYLTILQSCSEPEKHLLTSDFQIIQWGCNKATTQLLSSLKTTGIPMCQSSVDSRSYAMTLLHQLGRSALMRRAAEMMRCGFITAKPFKNGFTIRMAEFASSQFIDTLEFYRWEDLADSLDKDELRMRNEWEIFNAENCIQLLDRPGNFFGYEKYPFTDWYRSDIDELMMPLIRPWDSGKGIMVAYGARPEVDNHFLAKSFELLTKWRGEAGIHPNAQFGGTTGADVTAIVTIVMSFHLKHVHFVMLASKRYPEISIPQSLTIWGPMSELQQSISDFTGLEISRVQKAVEAITLQANEVSILDKRSTPFMPLLIGLDNGYVLRPISSLNRNPLLSVTTLLEWRYPKALANISALREEWLRSEIYGLFQGVRYICVDGNIKIKEGGKSITDIDAAIFDILTGELALIQIKWQDYFTNDIRKLRSKSSNLASELDEWSHAVSEWVKRKEMGEIANTLRLNPKKHGVISKIYLFAISRSVAQVQGFGFSPINTNLALANWPQFSRVRFELGPAKQVFCEMHRILKSEWNKKIEPKPIDVEILVAGRSIRFENLWNSFD